TTARAPSPVLDGAGTAPCIEVGISEAPGELVVHVAGEAGIAQVNDLTAALLRLSARRAPLVTLDLSRLNLLSILALGALVAFGRGVVRAGGRVRLAACLPERVRDSLERTGAIALFDLADAIEAPSAAPEPPARRTDRDGDAAVKRFPKVHDLERTHGV